jgi:tyrosinase
MKVAAVLASALTAAVSSTALSVSLPRDSGNGLTESPELSQLIQQAKSNVIDQVNVQERSLRKRGVTPKCTSNNLVFRQE